MKKSVLFCSLFAAAVSAHADVGFYVLGSVGQSRFDHDGGGFQGEVRDIESEFGIRFSSDDKKDTGYKLQLGYQFNEHFAIEGGYIDLGELTYKGGLRADADNAFNLKGKSEASGVNLDALLTLPINAGWSLFGKAGVINAKVKSKAAIHLIEDGDASTESDSESATKLKAHFGIGAAYKFHQNLSVRAEIERFNELGDSKTGKYNVDLFSVGVAYHF